MKRGGNVHICIDVRGAKLYAGTGIGTYTMRLMENIMSIDKSNFYSFFWPNEGYDIFLGNKNINITLFGERNKKFWDEYYMPKILSKISPDVFHLPQNGLGLPYNKYSKYVVTVHDLIPYTMPETCGKSYMEKFTKEMPSILDKSDIIITVSQYSKMDIIKYFQIPDEKIKVIYLAADGMFRRHDKEKAWDFLNKKYSYSTDFILYIGGFSPRKNVDGLMEAFKSVYKDLPGRYDLMILGSSKDEHYELKKKANTLGIGERVVFTGYIPYEHLPWFYNCAELFVYPSFYEGFGLPPLEAMTCGTPVITSNVTSIPEIVGDGAITIDPYDLNKLAYSIYDVLTDIELKNQLSIKGMKRAYQFSWKKTALETIKVYEEVCF